MRYLFVALLSLLANSTSILAQHACPVNFYSKDLAAASADIKGWTGRIVAFNGVVIDIKEGYPDKPYYKVAMDTGEIWIASLMKSGYEVPGKTVRILGYFSDTDNDTVAAKYNKTNYQVLAFGIVDLETKQLSMVPAAKLQVQEWVDGNIPKEHK